MNWRIFKGADPDLTLYAPNYDGRAFATKVKYSPEKGVFFDAFGVKYDVAFTTEAAAIAFIEKSRLTRKR